MKIIVKIELDDLGRNILANHIDGEATKRLATRKDVNHFVAGCLDAVLTTPFVEEPKMPYTEEHEIKRLQKAGFDDSYIRGWMQVYKGRACT